MRAIVLSGGGARGAYQLGFWKAIRKLRIKYDIVTGTSVGSLNGVLMTQKTYYAANYLWNHMDFKLIFDNDFSKTNDNLYKKYADFYFNEGITIKNFEKLINKVLNKNKFYNSKINYGLVTVNLKELKPVILTKKDIKRNELVDYMIASSTCYPFFPLKKINDVDYIDGGFYDTMPINLAIDMGATEVIAVDLNAIGIKQKVKNSNIPITYIKVRNKLSSPYDFGKEQARRAIKFGYNDTMKVFNKLDGDIFTFKKHHLETNYETLKRDYIKNFKKVMNFNNKNFIGEIVESITYRNILNDKLDNKKFNKLVEKLGLLLKIDESKIYSIDKYNKLLKKEFEKIDSLDYDLIEKKIKDKELTTLLNTKYIVRYIYEKMIKINDKKNYKELNLLAVTFNWEFLEALYLYTLNN